MFERFTERARQVVVLANQWSRDQRIGYVGAEQILLGLLSEEEGLAAKVLNHLGVTIEDAAEGVRLRIAVRLRDNEELEGMIPYTPRAKAVLEKALREALSLGHNYIGTEHILLGLVREGENVAMEILRDDFNLTPKKIRDEVILMLSGPKAPILKQERKPPAVVDSEELDKKAKAAIALKGLKDAHERIESASRKEAWIHNCIIQLARELPTIESDQIVLIARRLEARLNRDDV